MNDASGVTSSSLTPNCSHTISLTLACTDDAILSHLLSSISLYVLSAVNTDNLSSNIPGPRPSEKRHQLRHILARAKTAERNRSAIFFLNLSRQPGRHVGFNKTGSYSIHGDRPGGQLFGHGLGKADDARLRGGV